jgi:hypothetical protein
VNVYVVPLVNPVTVAGLALALVVDWAVPPMYGVMVYPVMVAPPLFAGAVQVIVAWPLPAAPVTAVGTPGTVVYGLFDPEVPAAPVPNTLIAATPNVYVVPSVSPVIVVLVAAPQSVVAVCATPAMYGVIT